MQPFGGNGMCTLYTPAKSIPPSWCFYRGFPAENAIDYQAVDNLHLNPTTWYESYFLVKGNCIALLIG